MNLLNKSFITVVTSTLLLTSAQSMASDTCVYYENGQRLHAPWTEIVIEPDTPIVYEWESSVYSWDRITYPKFDLDFGYNFENIQRLAITLHLTAPLTAERGFYTIRNEALWDTPSSLVSNWVSEGSNEIKMSGYASSSRIEALNNAFADGKETVSIYRHSSYETFEVVKITARICGIPTERDVIVEGATLSASEHNILSSYGEPLAYYIDTDTTYRVSAEGNATDENGNTITSVSVNYVDPHKAKNTTLQVNTSDEFYLHSDGKVSLYYATDSDTNTGGHTVKFERVNLD